MKKRFRRLLFGACAMPGIARLAMLAWRRLRPFGSRKDSGDELFPSLGTPIVRSHWHDYLQKHASDIRGHCLEIGTTATIRRFGGADITQADAVDLTAHSAEVTLVADLMEADHLEGGRYDCFVNQFTTHVLHDVPSSLYHSVRLLKPGGVLLVNFICTTGILDQGMDMGTGARLHQYWWFTPLHVRHLMASIGLKEEDYQLTSYGNVFTRAAWLMNLPSEFLTQRELHTQDAMHPIMLCVRVVRPGDWAPPKPPRLAKWLPPGAQA